MSDQKTLVAEAAPWRRLTLWSLALNVFLICGIAAYMTGSALHKDLHKEESLGKGGPAHQFKKLAARLPAEDANVLQAEFGKKADAIEEEHKAAHRTRDAVRQALSAEPYNLEATRQAISEAEAAHFRLDKLLQDVIASAAGKMTPEGRSKLAEFQPGPPRR